MVDVRFGIDTKYLETGTQYLVGASLDPETAVLTSKVRAAEPLFGGDEVIGAAETDVECPVLGDPVRTLLPNGSSVDSGVLTPLTDSKRSLLRACCCRSAWRSPRCSASSPCAGCSPGSAGACARSPSTMSEPREVRAVMRGGPAPASPSDRAFRSRSGAGSFDGGERVGPLGR